MDISFSIVIPLYNKEKEIGDTIRCVLNQTFTHYELIVVDDGSTDNSIGVVNSFNDNRIKLYQKNNDGVSSARNFGIQHARFDFIAFLDADDFWNETYLLKMQDLILQHPDCGMFSSLYQYKIGNDFEIPKFPNLSKSKHKIRINNYFKYSLKSPLINSSNVVIPKSVLAEVGGFNEDLVHGEDLEMWLKIANIYPFVIQL